MAALRAAYNHMYSCRLKKLRSFAFVFGLISLLPCVVPAELVWQQTSQSRSVDVRQAETVFHFRFRNTGTESVTILELKSSCGCYHPKLEKKEYAPGESGVLTVEAHLDGRKGHVNKHVEVIASNRPKKPYKLNIDIRIPQGYNLSTRRLLWSTGDKDSQTCTILNSSKIPIKLAGATSVSSGFGVELKEIRPGFEYELRVSPKNTSDQTRSIISITTEQFGDSPPRTYKVYAFVK